MTATREPCRPSYQVVVQGELRPAVLAFCAGPRADHKTAGAFRVRVHDDQGIADLAAMLQAAGLTILSIRQVTPTDAADPAPLSG
ncbi:hypothetical protein ACWCOV_00620 [Kribbella sp. NPDC002412]